MNIDNPQNILFIAPTHKERINNNRNLYLDEIQFLIQILIFDHKYSMFQIDHFRNKTKQYNFLEQHIFIFRI